MRILIFKEKDSWVAQCLEYDICASANSLEDLEYEFERTLATHFIACKIEGLKPLECLPPAPESFVRAFEKARPVELAVPRITSDTCSFNMPHHEAKVFAGTELQLA